MTNKKKLKEKLHKTKIQSKIERSKLMVENEGLSYKLIFAESQIRSLTREKISMLERLSTYESKSESVTKDKASK